MNFSWDKEAVPQFVVSLDEPPRTRWLPVIRDAHLRDRLVDLLAGSKLEDLFADADAPPPLGFNSRIDFFNALKDNLWAQLERLGARGIIEEIEGIANELKVPICEVVLLHLMYEAEGGGCTSVILPQPQGENLASSRELQAPLFGRVLDWDFAELLRPLTIQVKLVKDGKVIVEMLSFAGFVGCFTGRRPGVCAAAINYRRPSDCDQDVEPPSPESPAWPAALLVRSVLQEPDVETFSEALKRLSTSKLWAPCYFCLSGARGLDGVVILRGSGSNSDAGNAMMQDTAGDSQCETELFRLERSEGLLVQTNVDRTNFAESHESNTDTVDFMASKQRYDIVRHVLSSADDGKGQQIPIHQNQNYRKKLLWKALATSPVVDSASVHACVFGATMPMESAVLRVDDLTSGEEVDLFWVFRIHLEGRWRFVLILVFVALMAVVVQYYVYGDASTFN